MITRRQIDALQAAFTTGNAFNIQNGAIGNMGGAQNRMIEALQRDGYLDKGRDITAKGMRALLNWYQGRVRRAPLFAERIREIEARLPVAEQKEDEADRTRQAEEAERRRRAADRAATARVRRLAGFRKFFGELIDDGRGQAAVGRSFNLLDDDALLSLVERIVSKDAVL